MKFEYCMPFISNFDEEDPLEVGIESGKTRHGTGSTEKTPAAHTRHFQGQVTPPPNLYDMVLLP